ncbi:MAG TPA: DUF393 domain-containing protein [Sulfurovum sp.]|nr:DUF393 domain-containing protein [Sulfurovum sp.]
MNIIIFDGVCNLCSSAVQFIIRHDTNAYFYFTSLQSDVGKALVKKYKLEDVDSIVLIQGETFFTYSDAVIEIIKYLDGKWKYFTILQYIPKIIRDLIYQYIAKYRYRIFGRQDICMMPSEKNKSRFLE